MTYSETIVKAELLKNDFMLMIEFVPVTLIYNWLMIELESPTIVEMKITEWLKE